MKCTDRRINSTPTPQDPKRGELSYWPSSRYFQVHFEELQASMAILHQELAMHRRVLEELQRVAAQQLKAAKSSELEDDGYPGRGFFRFPDSNN